MNILIHTNPEVGCRLDQICSLLLKVGWPSVNKWTHRPVPPHRCSATKEPSFDTDRSTEGWAGGAHLRRLHPTWCHLCDILKTDDFAKDGNWPIVDRRGNSHQKSQGHVGWYSDFIGNYINLYRSKNIENIEVILCYLTFGLHNTQCADSFVCQLDTSRVILEEGTAIEKRLVCFLGDARCGVSPTTVDDTGASVEDLSWFPTPTPESLQSPWFQPLAFVGPCAPTKILTHTHNKNNKNKSLGSRGANPDLFSLFSPLTDSEFLLLHCRKG